MWTSVDSARDWASDTASSHWFETGRSGFSTCQILPLGPRNHTGDSDSLHESFWSHQILPDVTVDVCEPEIPSTPPKGQLLMIDSQLV